MFYHLSNHSLAFFFDLKVLVLAVAISGTLTVAFQILSKARDHHPSKTGGMLAIESLRYAPFVTCLAASFVAWVTRCLSTFHTVSLHQS